MKGWIIKKWRSDFKAPVYFTLLEFSLQYDSVYGTCDMQANDGQHDTVLEPFMQRRRTRTQREPLEWLPVWNATEYQFSSPPPSAVELVHATTKVNHEVRELAETVHNRTSNRLPRTSTSVEVEKTFFSHQIPQTFRWWANEWNAYKTNSGLKLHLNKASYEYNQLNSYCGGFAWCAFINNR